MDDRLFALNTLLIFRQVSPEKDDYIQKPIVASEWIGRVFNRLE